MVTCTAFRAAAPICGKWNAVTFTVLEAIVIAAAAYCIATGFTVLFFVGWTSLAAMQWLAHSADVGIFSFIILVFAFGKGLLSRFLGSGPLIKLGEMSYSIYLLHLTVFGWIRSTGWTSSQQADYPGLLLGLALTLGLSFIVWKYVEIPCRSTVKRWMGPALLARRQQGPTAAITD
jgi:peptidoglycan/LPS O-acetylase OafA/YrhL